MLGAASRVEGNRTAGRRRRTVVHRLTVALTAVVLMTLAAPSAARSTAGSVTRSPRPGQTTIAVRATPDEAWPTLLFASDAGNWALSCARGTAKPTDHRERTCTETARRRLPFDVWSGGSELTVYGARSSFSADGGYGLSEAVLLLTADGRPLHSLEQFSTEVYDGGSTTRRRRFRVLELDRSPGDDLCIETRVEQGTGLIDLLDTDRFVVSQRDVGYDAFTWDGTGLTRIEALDGRCPRTGYRLPIALPLTDDPVHRSRDR